MARTTRLSDLKLLGNQKALKGRSFQSLLGGPFPQKAADSVKLPEFDSEVRLNPATSLSKITDVPKGEPTQAPDIQDITLVSKNATRAEVPEIRFCDPSDSNFILNIYGSNLVPFKLQSFVAPLPQITIGHPLERRVKPQIPLIGTVGVPDDW
jgi:hypothetical protein